MLFNQKMLLKAVKYEKKVSEGALDFVMSFSPMKMYMTQHTRLNLILLSD